ncbi:MAG: hypothetical protein WD739_11185 [Actinomycetota bacterium]
MRRSPLRPAVLVVAMGLVAAACSSSPSQPPAGPAAQPSSNAAQGTPDAGAGREPKVPQVLDFSAPQLGGGTVEGASFAGRDVAIWFWAPW